MSNLNVTAITVQQQLHQTNPFHYQLIALHADYILQQKREFKSCVSYPI